MGQKKQTLTLSLIEEKKVNLFLNEFGIGNGLFIDDAAMLRNMHGIQKRHDLPPTALERAGGEYPGEIGDGSGVMDFRAKMNIHFREML